MNIVTTMKAKTSLLLFVMLLVLNTKVYAAKTCSLAYVPKVVNQKILIEIPIQKKTLMVYREFYRKNFDNVLSEIKKIMKSGSKTNISKLSDQRKFFVTLRHYAELFTKNGKLPKKIEELTKKIGKFSDAVEAGKIKKSLNYRDDIISLIRSLKNKSSVDKISRLKIVKRSVVRNRVQQTKDEISKLITKGKLSENEFHSLKKAVRRVSSVVRFRMSYIGDSHLKKIVANHKAIIDSLGETTDQIAKMKMLGQKKKLGTMVFDVPKKTISSLKSLLNNIVLTSTL
jgi:CHAD domain-containing protein